MLVLRKDRVEHDHFRTPTILPVLGAICCAFLAGPWTGRAVVQYHVAGWLIGIGIVLWVITMLVNRSLGVAPSGPEMDTMGGKGPVN